MFFFSACGRSIAIWFSQRSGSGKFFRPDLHLAGFDLGQIENVVDQIKQLLAAAFDVGHPAGLFFIQLSRGSQQNVAEAEDAVQRRAQFVAHGRQEVALEAVRFVKSHVGVGQFIDLAVEVGVQALIAFLHAHQVAEHAVEGVAEVFKFVAGLNFRTDVQLARGDGVADFL